MIAMRTEMQLTEDQIVQLKAILAADGICLCGQTVAPGVTKGILAMPKSKTITTGEDAGKMIVRGFCEACWRAIRETLQVRGRLAVATPAK